MTEAKITEDLTQPLASLRLRRMAEIVDRELAWATKNQVSYSDFLSRLLREQYQHQQMKSMEYRIQQAKLPERWTVESFPFKKQPGVSAKLIHQLCELNFIPRAENVVFIGQTGVGKTGLASGILLKALQNGYRGLFIKAQNLFDEMYSSLADRSTSQLVNRLIRIDVLLIDELGYLNLRPEQSNIFFKLMEERYQRKPTIITTNLEYEEWHGFLGNKKMVEALLDRLRHHCYTLHINGPSLREPQVS
jgi:DNA replication protein DnaC